jgi:protein-tyrosine-phosphatase/predicted ATP-grasp superfamily ATP-dependent carboligase
MHNKSRTILILGSSTKAGTYVAKQFNLAGYRVTVYDWSNLPNKHSKYINENVSGISPEKDLNSFTADLIKYLETHSVFALLPLHDAALEIVRSIRGRIPPGIQLLGLNEDDIYKYAHNKWELLKLARQSNIPVPKTVYIPGLNELENLNWTRFPCIVKPVSSALIKDGRLYSFKVTVANNYHELVDQIRELILNTPVMVQEFVAGYGIGFNFLSNKGEIISSYIHKRITEHAGVSSLREILSNDAYGNLETIKSFIKKINWTGVGMLEFKVNEGHPVLMELNGRFFGSIELSVKSGLNLPKQFLELSIENQIPDKNQRFRIHTKVRNLHDEVFLYSNRLMHGQVLSFFKWNIDLITSAFKKNEFIEDNIIDDPGFIVHLYLADFRRILKSVFYKTRLKFLNPPKANEFKLSGNISLRIAFICKGNICRSPFAEQYARSLGSLHTFFSFGTIPFENRLSPGNAIEASRKFKVDLDRHTSKYLKSEYISLIDIYVVMDKINYIDLIKMGISESRIKFLAPFEIPDPYKKNYDYFYNIYLQIKTSIDNIFKP